MNRGHEPVSACSPAEFQPAVRSMHHAWELSERRHKLEGLNIFQARRVAILVGSSRGGTSLLAALLRQHPDTLSLDGEHSAYYKLVGKSYPRLSSDCFSGETATDRRMLSWLFMTSLGTPTHDFDSSVWIDRLMLRLPMQTVEKLDGSRLKETLGLLHIPFELQQALPSVLHSLGVAPGCYDTYPLDMPRQPLSIPYERHPIIEEMPYVVPDIWKRAPTAEELKSKVLVLKASADAYRLKWLQSLFRGADVRIVHLTRNPAASINGLIDGWQSFDGFYSYNVGGLKIGGYSELHPAHERLWCFDLPPNWEAYRSAPLASVCGNQWSQAHNHILESLGETPRIRVRFEDVTASARKRCEIFHKLCCFLHLDEGDRFFKAGVKNMPVVMSTKPPHKYRWRIRRREVMDAVTQIESALLSELYRTRRGWT